MEFGFFGIYFEEVLGIFFKKCKSQIQVYLQLLYIDEYRYITIIIVVIQRPWPQHDITSMRCQPSRVGWWFFNKGTPTIWNSLPRHIRSSNSVSISWFTQDFLISKVFSAIVINSLPNFSSDFDLRTYKGLSSLPCIFHIASFPQNNLIAWKGRPRCLYLETKLALNSLSLFLLKTDIQMTIENDDNDDV